MRGLRGAHTQHNRAAINTFFIVCYHRYPGAQNGSCDCSWGDLPYTRKVLRMATPPVLTDEMKATMRIPYALRRAPEGSFERLLPLPETVQTGEIVLARIEKIGKNGGLELVTGRRATLHVGDFVVLVLGNRYATKQFEGYARINGDACDMLSMGGLCGVVDTKFASLAEPTKVRLLGMFGDEHDRPLTMRSFALPPTPMSVSPRMVVVCGSSMDAGKTYTTMSLIVGLRRQGYRVAGIKLTGTAAGRDLWSMIDAGACVGLDFTDGGWPSTYLTPIEDLLELRNLLLGHAAARGAEWAIVEVADGLLQTETAALLQHPDFTAQVHAWVLAAGEPMAAAAGASLLRAWGIEPVGVSGIVTMSPLGMREVEQATQLSCYTARDLQAGKLNARLEEIPALTESSLLRA